MIHGAQNDNLVASDPYVQARGLSSMLMLPILLHGDLTGLVYLENTTVSGAFNPNRLELLQLLASQAAMSIENARLHADLQEQGAARTGELKSRALPDRLTGVSNLTRRPAFNQQLAELPGGSGCSTPVAFRHGGENF